MTRAAKMLLSGLLGIGVWSQTAWGQQPWPGNRPVSPIQRPALQPGNWRPPPARPVPPQPPTRYGPIMPNPMPKGPVNPWIPDNGSQSVRNWDKRTVDPRIPPGPNGIPINPAGTDPKQGGANGPIVFGKKNDPKQGGANGPIVFGKKNDPKQGGANGPIVFGKKNDPKQGGTNGPIVFGKKTDPKQGVLTGPNGKDKKPNGDPKGKDKGPVVLVPSRKFPNTVTKAGLLPTEVNIRLESAQGKLDPDTRTAIDRARRGKLLSREDRALLGAAMKNSRLSAEERSAMASALQADMDAKRELAARTPPPDNGGLATAQGPIPGPAGMPTDPGMVPPAGPMFPGFPTPDPSSPPEFPGGFVPPVPMPSQPPVAAPGPADAGSTEEAVALPWQTERELVVKNETTETITVCVQYLAADKDGQGQWVGQKEGDEPLTVQVPAKKSVRILAEGKPIQTSRVRLWAVSDSGSSWTKYQEEDLILVDEAYRAASPGKYVYGLK